MMIEDNCLEKTDFMLLMFKWEL